MTTAIPFSQKVGLWLLEKSGCTLLDFCRKFDFPAREVKIMELDETDEKKSKGIIAKDKELKKLYLESAQSQKALSRRGENRSFTQYFKDLMTGWVLEDLTIEMLKHQGLDIRHHGKDRKRVIEIGDSVRQDADFLIKVGDFTRLVEISNEFNPILEKKGFIEKRSPCLPKLYQEKGIWVYRDIPRGKYVLVDFATEIVHLHLRHHDTVKADWSKDVNRYVLSENGKMERDDRLLAAELISVVGCSIEGKEQPSLDEVEDQDSPPKVFALGGAFKTNKKTAEKTVVAAKPAREEKKNNNTLKEKPIGETNTGAQRMDDFDSVLDDGIGEFGNVPMDFGEVEFI